jgi:probable phosphomutase (TIGR03848 family)
VTTVILLRHGRSTANVSGVLAGRSTGVGLDDHGRAQAEKLVDRLAELPLAAVVTSPLQRCQETVAPLLAARGLEATVEDDLSEVDYGDWTGRKLGELGKEDLWKVVQAHPSAVRFPGGEAMADAQHRAVTAVREWNDGLKPDATFLVCSHGDIIKSIVADALGLHLDQFQRIQADPASVTVIRYTEMRPFVVRLNDNGGKVDDLLAKSGQDSDAPVGGGA